MKVKPVVKDKVVKKEEMRTKRVGIAVAAIILASVFVVTIPPGNARAVIAGIKTFAMFNHITLALSFLLAISGFAYFILKRRKKEAERGRKEEIMETIKEVKEWRAREEELMEIIKELKELKERMEEKGIELTTISDIFLIEVLILSGIRNVHMEIRNVNEGIDEVKTWILFGLSIVVAICLAIISMF